MTYTGTLTKLTAVTSNMTFIYTLYIIVFLNIPHITNKV